MYRYDEFDQAFVTERISRCRGQVARRLADEITKDQCRPLRLMNGVYLKLHAYMLRTAVPYGTLNSARMRMHGFIARTYARRDVTGVLGFSVETIVETYLGARTTPEKSSPAAYRRPDQAPFKEALYGAA